jgi:hypothetical protein
MWALRQPLVRRRTMDKLHTNKIAPSSRKFSVLLILAATLVLMGGKWVEKPVESLESVSGTWKGSGITAKGFNFETEYVFKKDGSFDYWVGGRNYSDKGQRPPGTLYINAGKLMYKNKKGILRTGILEEDKKGRRVLKFHGDDGMKLDVRPAKK